MSVWGEKRYISFTCAALVWYDSLDGTSILCRVANMLMSQSGFKLSYPSCLPRGILYPQKLALTSPTSGGRSVDIVRSRTQTTEFVFVFVLLCRLSKIVESLNSADSQLAVVVFFLTVFNFRTTGFVDFVHCPEF
jgi:hypothetical protein